MTNGLYQTKVKGGTYFPLGPRVRTTKVKKQLPLPKRLDHGRELDVKLRDGDSMWEKTRPRKNDRRPCTSKVSRTDLCRYFYCTSLCTDLWHTHTRTHTRVCVHELCEVRLMKLQTSPLL